MATQTFQVEKLIPSETMVKVKSCPNCNGALYREHSHEVGYVWTCLNCGRDFYPSAA